MIERREILKYGVMRMDDKLFDFEEMFYLFKKKFWIIILVTIITTGFGVYKVSKYQPSYVARAKIFIGKSTELMDFYSQQEMEYYSQFIGIFTELSKIEGFLDDGLKKAGIDIPSTAIASSLGFSGGENVPIYTITYSSYTEQDMAKILNTVCDILVKEVKDMMLETVPKVLSKASVATIYPDKKKLPIIAFGAGIVLSIGLILVIDYLDDRVVSKKQLSKALPIPVIGEIPTHEKTFMKEEKDVSSKQTSKVTVSRSV